jgi:tyrosyl-tRNA synthetase
MTAVSELTQHAVHVLPEGELERKVELGRPLRVKLGIDATSPDIHLGFAYVLDRLAEFQRSGHVVVLIVGDYTARIGDPSGRSDERPVLPDDVIDANAKEFSQQAFRVLDPDRTEIRFNGEWLGKLSYAEVVRLARTITVARILERDDFAQRYRAHEPISISELLYPLMQAYDSVAIEADIEIGGTDQLYNLLTGRDVMQHYGVDPQVVMTYPLLVGLDGEEKMSKSRGNYIGINDPPEEMFGKTMSIPDSALPQWWEMLIGGEQRPDDPMEWKLELARRLVRRWHGDDAVGVAEEHFTRVVRQHEAPEAVDEVRIGSTEADIHLPAFLAEQLGQSSSHWRRVIDQGGVKLNGAPVAAYDISLSEAEGAVLQAGKRHFMRLTRG